ncbi:MAG: lamin tail domain-containing protein [Verrucomicrobiota bacterium]
MESPCFPVFRTPLGLGLAVVLSGPVVLGQLSMPPDLSPALGGGPEDAVVRRGPDAWELRNRGRGILTANADQAVFAGVGCTNDFDVQVRVDDLLVSNPFVRAGLMLRSSTNATATFAAVYASSPMAGCFAETRASTGGAPTRTSNLGGFPSAPPTTWLRMRREGVTVTTFASADGQAWTRMASVFLDAGPDAQLGLVATSQNAWAGTRALFSGLGNTAQTNEVPWLHAREGATPSSRRTGLIFSEIQYAPGRTAGDQEAPEFIEIANHGDVVVDMTGWTLDGAVGFRFPDGFLLQAGARVVVTSQPGALAQGAGLAPVLGPWTGALDNAGDSLRLRDAIGAVKLKVQYSPLAPWPVAADGSGHSLVLASPSRGQEDPMAWIASRVRGGSPGRPEPVESSPLDSVVLNEVLAHTDLPQTDFVEVYNRAPMAVDLSGCILTDDVQVHRFRIPAGAVLGGGSEMAWDETTLGFRLSAAGEAVYLLSPDGRRVLDVLRFGAQENGVALGRCPDGADAWRRLAQPTPGAANAPRRLEDVVINEIFYNPPRGDADEFVELAHRGSGAVDLTGWRVRGGISFDFPAGARLEPGEFLVLAKDPVQLRANHPTIPAARVFGGYQGTLGNGGDVVRLTKPDDVQSTNSQGVVTTDVIHIPVGEVRYADGGAWGQWSDGGGSSLELEDPDADPGLASNWADSDESQKASWTLVEWTGRMDNGNGTMNRLYIGLLNNGECLLDDVQVIGPSGTNVVSNAGFESGPTGWLMAGNHAGSKVEASAARNGLLGLRVLAQGGLDTGPNAIRVGLTATLPSNNNVTFRAWTRWVAGWPELLFRLRGNHADYAAPLVVPRNLGTPGKANSRRVANVGPAIHSIAHAPVLPRLGEAVRVTARAEDADGVVSMGLRYRLDPTTTTTDVPMRDDGLDGDDVARDGVYTGVIPGQSSGVLVAFTIRATDGRAAESTWPSSAPLNEGLVRWNEPVPFTSLPHAHLWCTSANRNAPGGNPLNNAYRRGTVVYGNTRVVHQVIFRDKGSPYHGGSGDITVRTPADDLLHGVSERLFSKTGNGGVEDTALRGRVANWLASRMGLPSLEGKHQLFYINGASFANVVEDLEEPDHAYAEDHFPDGDAGDLYKISIWFEFQDDNRNFASTSATMESFLSGGQPKLARYRWNWERRAREFPESNYQTIFDLAGALNSRLDAGFPDRVLQQADIEEWMGVFAFHRVTGNWDSWTYNVGQNMYLYRQPGRRAVLLPWDIDFVLGLGDGTNAGFTGGQDPMANARLYDQPPFRRMLWRALYKAANGPLLPAQFVPVVDGYRLLHQQNNITGLAAVSGVTNYMTARRTYILSQLNAPANTPFAITSNGGNDFASPQPVATITGTASFLVADIAVNGARYPVNWTGLTTFSVSVPLTLPTNALSFTPLDASGKAIGASDSISVTYAGAVPQARDWVVLNEVHYNPAVPGTSFVELFNRNPSVPFNLDGFHLDGLGYNFPSNATILPNGFLVLASDRAAFGSAFGASIPVLDEFTGKLDNDGERLGLLPPGSDVAFSQVRYRDRAPWPTNADGWGPSLQLLDPAQDTRRPANWAATAPLAVNRATPGAANSLRASLPAFPTVWINEVCPAPSAPVVDNAGDADPFVELFNPTDAAADLSGLWLGDGLATPQRWQIPPNTVVGPRGSIVVWLDNEPGESAPGQPHAGFRIPPGKGSVVLSRLQGSPPAVVVLDWLDYETLPAGRGMGSVPDGDPYARRPLYVATPGQTNSPAVPRVEVVVNELLASNTSVLADPADGDFDDWIELYNLSTAPADLSGYFLTDNLANKTASVLPAGTIVPPGGFLLVWADGETSQTDVSRGWFHAGFSLARGGEAVGLFAPDGSLVDGFAFGPQTNNVSLGRYPDGPGNDLMPIEGPTPEAFNSVPGGNLPPRFQPISTQSATEEKTWRLRVQATDPDAAQTVRYELGPDAPVGVELDATSGALSWTPTEAQGPAQFAFTLRAIDSGSPARSASARVTVDVAEANRPPVGASVPAAIVDEGNALTLQLKAIDLDLPAQGLRFVKATNAPSGLSVDAKTGLLEWTPSEDQGPKVHEFDVTVLDSFDPPGVTLIRLQVNVAEVDNPPVFTQPQLALVAEGTEAQFQLEARDPDGAPVTYSIVGDAPQGLRLDPVTGVMRWEPTEQQGPAIYPVVVRATETTALGQSAQATFSIQVLEANQPPRLAPIPAATALEGEVVSRSLVADDDDLPPQNLTFSLVGIAPPGVVVDPVSGRLTWNIPADMGRTNAVIRVQVSDDALPAGVAERAWEVSVQPRFKVAISEILCRPVPVGSAYIELANASAITAWDLSGCRLVGRTLSYEFPGGTILAPGQALCVAANLAAFRAAHGPNPRAVGPWTGTLGSDGDDLVLFSMAGDVLNRVPFAVGGEWPDIGADSGQALQLIDLLADNASPGAWTATTAFTSPRDLTTLTSSWRYLESVPVGAWTTGEFDDRAWKSGGGLLYVETAALPATKTTALNLGQWSYYFRTSFVLPSVPTGATLALAHVVDDGMVLYLNGTELTRFNMPDGAVGPATPASVTVGDATSTSTSLPGSLLRAGTNVLAAEVHQSAITSSDVVFGVALRLEGGNLPSNTPGASNSIVANLAPLPAVFLNELAPRPGAYRDAAGQPEPWLELYNGGTAPVVLDGWQLSASSTTAPWTFPAGLFLRAGERRVIVLDGEASQSTPAEWHASFRPAEENGWIALVRPSPVGSGIVDSIRYGAAPAASSWSSVPEWQRLVRMSGVATPGRANPSASTMAPAVTARWTGNSLAVTWPSVRSSIYRVDMSEDPTMGWIRMESVLGTGGTMEVSDPLPSAAARFYRVVIMP